MTDSEILELIALLQRGEGKDEEVGDWIGRLKRTIRCPNISDLIFYGEASDNPETILRKAREYRPIQL